MKNLSFFKFPYWGIITGHMLFILSGVFYSIYWILNYYNQNNKTHIFSSLLFILSLLVGILGTILLVYTLAGISDQITGQFKIWHIILFSVVFFILSLFITSKVFHRQFTSEIFFIMLWAGIEISCIYAFYCLNWFSVSQFIVSLSLAFICLLVGMVCYIIHYKIPEKERFINGLVPYLVISLYMLVNTIILFVNKIPVKDNISTGS